MAFILSFGSKLSNRRSRFLFELAQKRLRKFNKPGFAPAFLRWLVRSRHFEYLHQPSGFRSHQEDAITQISGLFDRVRDNKDRRFLLFPELQQKFLHAESDAWIQSTEW